MSRIIRGRIVDGDQVDATDLNDRFDDYSQAGALNRFNVRDAAFDLGSLSDGRLPSTVGRYNHRIQRLEAYREQHSLRTNGNARERRIS